MAIFSGACVKETPPRKEVQEILTGNNGKLVEIEDFDSLMFDLLEALDLKLLDAELLDTAKKRADAYRDSVKQIQDAKSKSPDKDDRNAANKLFEKVKKDTPWSFILRAGSEKNKEKNIEILESGLKKFPDNIDLLNELAWQFYLKRDEKAKIYYKKALELDDANFVTNANYAIFLKNIIKIYDEAEKYYQKALALYPDAVITNGNYAGFLLGIGKSGEGKKYLAKAFALCDRKELELELWFYTYAHIKEKMQEAEEKINQLLQQGERSVGWDFSLNIETAIKNNHPHPEKLKTYAQQITTPVQ